MAKVNLKCLLVKYMRVYIYVAILRVSNVCVADRLHRGNEGATLAEALESPVRPVSNRLSSSVLPCYLNYRNITSA
ncbi:hypothetical protein PUN28_018427 [Cardiocondyla obscurior]|uniref:Secreted protein n=1 Tax=Cardiocondyla obscurior TaxID=286306 RepID=A0AAW2EDT5_9HYME